MSATSDAPGSAAGRPALERLRTVIAGVWTGGLVSIAAITAPAAFSVLPAATAGQVMRRVFASEAAISVVLGVVLILIERRLHRDREDRSAMSAELLLPAAAVFCTVAGYYALLPMMAEARAGRGAWSFGALHAASSVFFGVKLALVGWLLWRTSR